jgi:hypothetical protein
MAQNISLPIYKTSYDVLMVIFQLSAKFSRELKFTLGEKMKSETVELLVDICKINKTEKKNEELFLLAFNRVERIRIYLRIAKDLKEINLEKFVDVNEKIEYILKQLSLWEKNWARVA